MSGEARAETMTRPPLLPPHLGDALEYMHGEQAYQPYQHQQAAYQQAVAYSAAYDPRFAYGPQPVYAGSVSGFRPGPGYGYHGWDY